MLVVGLLAFVVPASAQGAISSRGPASRATYAAKSVKTLRVKAPRGARTGDVLVAALVFGRSSKSAPGLTPPPGWNLINRIAGRSGNALAVYRHVFQAGESRYAWRSARRVGGTVAVAAFAGVDTDRPIDTSAARETARRATIPTPSLTTTVDGAMLVASFGGFSARGITTWSPPAGMTELADAAAGSRSSSIHTATQAVAGRTGRKKAKASARVDDALAILTALRPAALMPPAPPAISAEQQPPAPPVAPAISAVQAQAVTTTSATITWATDQPSDSQVEYGTTTSYGSSTAVDGAAVTSHSQTISGLTPSSLYHFRVKSRNANGQRGLSADFTFQTAARGAVPLIIDTDIWSNVDDVGALAAAFGLQLRGEAKVIALGVNTHTSRPAVAADSWRCVAAITAFYGFSSVPLGAALPNNGTGAHTPDFVGPCARLAPPGTATPESAVRVFRRALSAQPNGSVVMASIGYFGNLSALLDSPGDAISPLTGHQLVQRKVKALVAMAGAYPSSFGETNLAGDPAAAQNVASHWPTTIVWSGREVGDQIRTGQTISSIHPAWSPVRAAYEAFAGPRNWIYSYDPTALYHAVRPNDSLLTEVGPGTNVVTGSGGNSFLSGSGNQYYLNLTSPIALDSSIEVLLDTLP
jgi:inosine-uridine nucleoside N-ribohydrolase